MSKVLHLGNEEQFDSLISSNELILVDFFASWCRPCQMLAPVLDDVSEEVDFKIVKIDVEEFANLAGKFSIRTIPTLLVFNNGELKATETGYKTKVDLINFVETNK